MRRCIAVGRHRDEGKGWKNNFFNYYTVQIQMTFGMVKNTRGQLLLTVTKLFSCRAACFSVVDRCQAMSELCVEPLWYGEQENAIARISDTYLFENMFRAINTILNNLNIQGKEYYCVHALKILLRHCNRWTQSNHHEPSCGLRSSWEGRKTPPFSPLPLSTLWYC